jgi:CRP-like cAMP-binding protein
LIATISFWDNCTPDFLTQIVLNLGVRVYMPDDYVVRRREIGHEMMMINLGYCKLSKPLKRLNEAKEDPAETAAASDELTDEDNKPVLLPQDFDSDASGDESYDESSDDDNEDATSRVRSSPRNIRRASGLVFELQGSDLDSDHPRRRSIPSSVPSSTELEQPKTFQTYLKPGQVFGEMSLLMNYKRQANIRAVTFVEMCVLDRATFQKIISRYPEDRRRVLTKMLQSCIEKKEIPFPWENIIEAVSAKRRSSGLRDITRASVIATMTAAEAARILVESIDVNVPDESIKYGFQSFEQEFVEEPALRRANSVGAKIRETLQRTNSGIRDTLQRSNSGLTRETLLRSHSGLTPLRAYSRRNSSADSCRSSSTGDLTELESEMSGVSSHSIRTTEKTLETMMQLMHTMVESIGRLQRDVNELKSRTCCCSREPGASKGNRHHAPKRSKSATVVANRDLDRGQAPAKHSPDREHADSEEPRTIVNESAKQEPQASRKSSLLAMLPSSIRSISRQNSGNSTSPNARTGLMNSGRASQRSPKSKNSGSKVSPRSDVSAVDKSESSLLPLELDPYANPRHSSRSRPGRQPTLADILWKRSNSSTDHARTPSRNSQTLKSRHSMPAGVSGAPGGSDEDKQPPLADDQEPPVGHEETENLPHQRGQSESARDYPVDSSRASNRDPRCLTIDE